MARITSLLLVVWALWMESVSLSWSLSPPSLPGDGGGDSSGQRRRRRREVGEDGPAARRRRFETVSAPSSTPLPYRSLRGRRLPPFRWRIWPSQERG